MNAPPPAFTPFAPIERHGVIGDRRTGALVAADGTIDWFCAPDFDCAPVLGALLDSERGGFFRVGTKSARFGQQRYVENTAILVTTWPEEGIELADVMAWPDDDRAKKSRDQRIILRRLRATSDATVLLELRPRRNFKEPPSPPRNAVFHFDDGVLGMWASFPVHTSGGGVSAEIHMRPRDEHWIVLGWNLSPDDWSVKHAAEVFASTKKYWEDWCGELKIENGGERTGALKRSALTLQLLSGAPHDSALAALTTSLPERIGGDRNYDYRCAWVRDASLSLAMLARMGKTGAVQRYLEWLCKLDSKTDSPLQVCYRFDGSPDVDEEIVAGVRGYRDSLPVRYGNRAAKQNQSGSFGFLLDCARIYFDEGGKWEKRFWRLIQRAADHVCSHWRQEDNGIWELPEKAHYVASKVMCWVVLERASHIARETGYYEESARWLKVADEIYAEVMDKGWCETKRSFRQRYGSDALDAASLLIPLMEFLPIDHPRVLATVEALERELTVDGLLHRFDSVNTPGCGGNFPIGEFEGAFLPCVFWHAHTLAKMGRCDEAEAILARCEKIAGDTGLFAEEIDAKTNAFLGNMPLLFAHVEYVRAVVELHKARKKTTVKTMKTPHQPRVIVITGAAGGVGRAAARMFAKTEGAHIGLLARGQEALEAAKREVEELGGKAVVLPCDVADADAVEAAAARVEAELGPIDVWVNVAMTSVFAFVIDTTPAEFKRVTEVCYLGYVNGTLAALKRMLPRNRGHIVQVGSALAYRGIPLQAAYCASKHAIQGFMDSLRAELIHKKSRVVATMVQMPALNTPQFDWCRNKMPRKAQPVPPIYQPEVAAKAIVFASKSNRREIYVGMPTVIAIIGNKLFPGLGDRYLAKNGVQSQQTGEENVPGAPDNLHAPLPGDFGAHGRFDAVANRSSAELWMTMQRSPLVAGTIAAFAALSLAVVFKWGQKALR